MFSFLLLPLPLFFHVASALLNVTIDDTDTMIQYNGLWTPDSQLKSSLDYGGAHTISTDPTANAIFTFTGTAVYYLAPRWSYAIFTDVSLDGAQPETVNLTDPNATPTQPGGSESAEYSVAWWKDNLANTTHKVVVTMTPGQQQTPIIIVDGFIYTVNNRSSATSSRMPSPSSKPSPSHESSSSPSSTTIPSTSDKLAIEIGVGAGAVVLIAAIGITFFFYRRRRQQKKGRVSNVLDEWGQDYPPAAAVTPFRAATVPERPTHEPSMSDASRPLLTPAASLSWDRSAAPAPVSRATSYRDDPHTAPISEFGYRPGDEGAYEDGMSDSIASGSGSTSITAPKAGYASARNEKAVPPREMTQTPGPPAYTES
ncbi:hypothetical protein K438DRAFT_1730904 [Mycena galopus ATCC 62051]|nr:hypothetical protein K438DRAFT_1730904 [Mycena galopus ATCC 62051]